MAANKFLKDEILKLRREGYNNTKISSILNCSVSTVKYHCSKNNLSKKGIFLTEEIFNNLKNDIKTGVTQKEASLKYGISISTIKRYLNYDYSRLIKYKKEKYTIVKNYRKLTKIKAIEYKGGCCSMCGYKKSVLSLSFHHIDPMTKDFQISGLCRNWESIKKELDKCILVCNNCHGEIHEKLGN